MAALAAIMDFRSEDGSHGIHLGFLIGKIFATFDLHVTQILPTKFWVNWPFSSGKEAKYRFSRWRPTWISDQNDFSYFWSTNYPDASNQVSSQLAKGCSRSRLLKQIDDAAWWTTHKGHWPIAIAHHEHFVLRWANKANSYCVAHGHQMKCVFKSRQTKNKSYTLEV